MANNTDLKDIERAMAEYKTEHGTFVAGKVYGIEYSDKHGKPNVYKIPVYTRPDALYGGPEGNIIHDWEKYARDASFDVMSVTSIREEACSYDEWWESVKTMAKGLYGVEAYESFSSRFMKYFDPLGGTIELAIAKFIMRGGEFIPGETYYAEADNLHFEGCQVTLPNGVEDPARNIILLCDD